VGQLYSFAVDPCYVVFTGAAKKTQLPIFLPILYAFSQKIKQIELRIKDLYWIIGRKSPASLESKILLYKTIISLSGSMESNYGNAPANRI
jgi:hypothetical protein